MQLKQLTLLLFLSLGAVSYSTPVPAGQEVTLSSRDYELGSLKARAAAAPKSKPAKNTKHGPSKIKGGKSCPRKPKGRRARRELAKRAIKTFVMNQAPQGIASAKKGDILRTGDLGGCSVVVVYTTDAAYGVHVAGGDGHGNHDAMATNAINALIRIIPKTFQKSNAKAFMFTPILVDPNTKRPIDDTAADKLVHGLEAAGLDSKLTWNNYDLGQIAKVSDADASVEVVFGAAGSYPTINAGGVCGVPQN